MQEIGEEARTRAFVGLDLPDELKAGISRWSAEELSDPGLRVPPPEQLHITLAFLGWLDRAQLERAAEVVWLADATPVALELEPEPVAPGRGRPSLFALDVVAPAALEVRVNIENDLEAAGVYEPEERPFWPHVTVARVRTERGKRRPVRVERAPGRLPEALCERTFAVRITLYRSQTKSGGALYTPLAQVELPGA